MATRSQAREAVAGLLYAFDSGNTDILNAAPTLLEEKKIRNAQQRFALELLAGVLARVEVLDNALQPLLKDWDLKRIGCMERAILRLGAYEILHTPTKPAVVINEAIELAKVYGEDNAPKLVNAVLDHLVKASR
ncbi:transcription antitermination factor NusB [Helicobacter ailurogastricus]|uniref:Transcription antitermination protein NusB n=1 Tax=Helicobacter ailurogastricus TaxID=1578720 RepID=A0A0K2XY64_9HELI|nr:transcription antitermination factor NusB [Helicobacter ailurogastricus]BDQ29199.1 N utilization substance protein B [Helicobacter ailurogastricus]CRF52081.1 Transcription termination protein NusB [Helicobacter ailurogastricus]